jgi:uncharacterized membrane protein YidH (DUF202 family)
MSAIARIGASTAIAVVVVGVAGQSRVFAGHETRTTDIQETGLDMWIVGLSIGAAVVALVAFAIVMLIWEHRDEKAESHSSSGEGP